MLLSFWMGVKEEGWSVLIWFCFQTTWCIRTIKISASHSLIALWVSAAGAGTWFWISCGSADALRAGYLFWRPATSKKTHVSGSVCLKLEQGQNCWKWVKWCRAAACSRHVNRLTSIVFLIVFRFPNSFTIHKVS